MARSPVKGLDGAWTFVRSTLASPYASAVPTDLPPVLQVAQPEDGGVAEHVLQLALGLERRGWPVHVAGPPGSGIRRALASAAIPFHELPMGRAPALGDVGAARLLRSIDARGGYAIVHAHSSKAGALARLALPRSQRLVYTPHCFAFAAHFDPLRRAIYTAAEQALVPRSAAIIGVCEWERDEARRRLRGADRRMDVVLNGVGDCGDGRPDAALTEWKGDGRLAGMVAALRPQKDPLTLVRAAARLGGEARVAIVGNGELAGAIDEEIGRLGIGERVRRFPFDGAVAPYLHALDLFVLPSAWEALPISILEAMACGVPVLATRVGGVAEAVDPGETGELVAARDPDALGDALARLLADPDRLRSLGTRAREVARERFGVDAMVDATALIYDRLLR
jgi:glycosyltransferase involved in cell wall biosynthesis